MEPAAPLRDHLFHLRPDSGVTLQAQLRRQLVDAILEGRMPPGSPLPSCRQLSANLGIARNTVALAYQELVNEGFLVSAERRGFFVADDVMNGHAAAPASPTPVKNAAPGAGDGWERRLRLRPTRQRNIVKPGNWADYPYPFIYGQIDPAAFPIATWRECSRQALARNAVREWSRDHFNEDDKLLIEQIRTRLLPRRGVAAHESEILVTVGAQHAIYLIASLLADGKTTVGIENPGYADARNIFALRARELIGLETDAEGLVPDDRLAPCDYVYVTPSHQFPTTVTMTLDRREALLARAERDDFVIIEDDYESEISHIGLPHPALKTLDRNGRVLFVASLSKTLAPGLRLGYLVGPRALIEEARAMRRLMLRHPPANNQRTIAIFLADGHHDALLRKLSQTFKERWQILHGALARHLPDCRSPRSTGGTAVWVEGPPWLDADRLAIEAAAKGIVIEPGAVHFLDENPPRHCFRLGFSSIATEKIEPGIKLLAEVVRRHRNGG
jgi:GntR family transcriptional regulator/MocR family aminotransferase